MMASLGSMLILCEEKNEPMDEETMPINRLLCFSDLETN